jgi:hypothetical protein
MDNDDYESIVCWPWLLLLVLLVLLVLWDASLEGGQDGDASWRAGRRGDLHLLDSHWEQGPGCLCVCEAWPSGSGQGRIDPALPSGMKRRTKKREEKTRQWKEMQGFWFVRLVGCVCEPTGMMVEARRPAADVQWCQWSGGAVGGEGQPPTGKFSGGQQVE